MTTTLTREALMEKLKPRYQEVEVEGFGKIGIKSITELKRTRRASAIYDENGKMVERNAAMRRVHAIIDQVMSDENTAMFTDEMADDLVQMDSHLIDKLYLAVIEFNGDKEEKKDESAGSSES